MKPRIVTPADPLTVIDLARARLQCKLTGTDRDADVIDAIAAARAFVEAEIGLPVGEQVREYTWATWSGSAVLPCDVTELLAVTTAEVAVTPLPALAGRTLTVAATAPVVVRIRCGWTAATLPATVKQAMLLLIADFVRNPQAQTETQLFRNHALDALLWPERERLPL
jgi:hypothetical protein